MAKASGIGRKGESRANGGRKGGQAIEGRMGAMGKKEYKENRKKRGGGEGRTKEVKK